MRVHSPSVWWRALSARRLVVDADVTLADGAKGHPDVPLAFAALASCSCGWRLGLAGDVWQPTHPDPGALGFIASWRAGLDNVMPPLFRSMRRRRKQAPKREQPPHLPRRDVHHEPQNMACACVCGCEMKRIGQDFAEPQDYETGVFTVERHVRGKWACAHIRTLVQAPMPTHVIDKGSAELLLVVG